MKFKFKLLYVVTLGALSATAYADPASYTHVSGATVIDISKPNASGLSHNTYKDFNVSSKGTVLNNSALDNTVTSVGRITGNSNVANGAAKVILNEVISNKSSALNGFIEVAGQKADVIIANPNGISCSGCSFVNAGRTTLTTGALQLADDGSLTGFNVSKGNITINKGGLTNSGNFVELLARSININGPVMAGTVIAGSGGFDYNYTSGMSSSHGDTPGIWDLISPSYSIDVSQLGGIKANQIQLVGNSYGFGVRNNGSIVANNALEINSLGQLENNGTLSSTQGNTSLMSLQDLRNNGALSAGNNLNLISYGNLNNGDRGEISANTASIYFIGSGFTNSGSIDANQLLVASMDQNGALASGKITNNGKINAQITNLMGGEFKQSAQGKVTSTMASISAPTINNSGKIQASNVTLTGTNLNNDGTISASQDLTANLTGKLSNVGSISSDQSMTLNVDTLQNYGNCFAWWCTDGSISADTLAIKSRTVLNIRDLNGSVTAKKLEFVSGQTPAPQK